MKWPIIELIGSDLSEPNHVKTHLNKLPPCAESILEIDFSKCLIDYPATSIVLDYAFNQLVQAPGDRQLLLIIDYELPQQILLRWMLQGSQVLGLSDTGGLEDSTIESQLEVFCAKENLIIIVRLINFSNLATISEKSYGNK